MRIQGCPSAAPYGKRNAHLPHEARIAGVTSYAQAKRSCEVHESVCGVYGGRSLGYECIDTARDLENCKSSPSVLHTDLSLTTTLKQAVVAPSHIPSSSMVARLTAPTVLLYLRSSMFPVTLDGVLCGAVALATASRRMVRSASQKLRWLR